MCVQDQGSTGKNLGFVLQEEASAKLCIALGPRADAPANPQEAGSRM